MSRTPSHVPIITTQDLSIRFDTQIALNKVHLEIPKGAIVAIMGTSGSGKTTLLRALCGLIPKHLIQGQILIQGQSLTQMPPKEKLHYHLQTGYLFQNHALFLHLTVFENVAYAMHYHQMADAQTIEERTWAVLESVNLKAFAHHTPDQLSGGMAKRAAFARCIVHAPSLLFCDEPFSGQDPIHTEQLANLILTQNQTHQTTTLLVSHEYHLTPQIASYLYIVRDGKIHAHGSPKTLQNSTDPFVQRFFHPEKNLRKTS